MQSSGGAAAGLSKNARRRAKKKKNKQENDHKSEEDGEAVAEALQLPIDSVVKVFATLVRWFGGPRWALFLMLFRRPCRTASRGRLSRPRTCRGPGSSLRATGKSSSVRKGCELVSSLSDALPAPVTNAHVVANASL